MRIQELEVKVNTANELIASYDVSSDELHFYCEAKRNDNKVFTLEDTVSNTYEGIKNHFLELEEEKIKSNLDHIHVFFEPTGGYEDTIKTMAFKRGYKVNYISGEATKKASVIEGNENGKSDKKDTRVINTLAKMSKSLTCRDLPENYALLRQTGNYYEDESLSGGITRNKISKIQRSLFPGLNYKSKFLYTVTGKNILEIYGFNPYKIAKKSPGNFVDRMKKRIPKCNRTILNEVYRKAKFAVNVISKKEAQLLEEQLKWLYDQYTAIQSRKEKLKAEMLELYTKLSESEKLSLVKGMPQFQCARVIAETGPLNDFKDSAQIIKYAGLNIKLKQSGKYKGKEKISKKGRALLRKILYQLSFSSLIKKGGCYCDYFKTKKKQMGNGIEAMVAVMRKALKMIFGVVASCMNFDINRVHMCQTEYNKLKSAI
jgi:transposase